jgi:hypothetical protein
MKEYLKPVLVGVELVADQQSMGSCKTPSAQQNGPSDGAGGSGKDCDYVTGGILDCMSQGS